MTVSHRDCSVDKTGSHQWGKQRQHSHHQHPADLTSLHPTGISLTQLPESSLVRPCVPARAWILHQQPAQASVSARVPAKTSPLTPTTMDALRPAHPAGLWTLSASAIVKPQESTPEPGAPPQLAGPDWALTSAADLCHYTPLQLALLSPCVPPRPQPDCHATPMAWSSSHKCTQTFRAPVVGFAPPSLHMCLQLALQVRACIPPVLATTTIVKSLSNNNYLMWM